MRQQQVLHPDVLGLVRQEVGQALRHLIAAVLLAIAVGAVAVEMAGMVATHAWPALPTHVAAIVVALLAGYAAGVTVLFRALLRAIGRSAEWVTNEVEQAARRVLHEAEPSPFSGRQRLYAEHVVDAAAAPAEPAPSAGPTLHDGVVAGLRS
jgi:hypothetical protein